MTKIIQSWRPADQPSAHRSYMKDTHGKRRASILFDKQKRCCRCFLVSIQIINHLVLFFMMTCLVVHPLRNIEKSITSSSSSSSSCWHQRSLESGFTFLLPFSAPIRSLLRARACSPNRSEMKWGKKEGRAFIVRHMNFCEWLLASLGKQL